jgi:hypothetical protein
MVVAQPMQAREGAGAAPGSVGLTIAPGEATVAASGALELTALIYNMGSTSDHYLLDVAGVPPGWASIDAPFFSLAAGGLQRVAVTVRPPVATAPTPAGAPLRLTVRASADGNLAMPGLVSVALTVRGPQRATMELDRAEATGAEATFRATFHNPTAAPAPVALAVDDGGAGLRVRIAPDEALLIPPGERATLTVLVRPPRRAPAAPRAYDLTLRALDARGPDTGAPADLASSRRARFMYAPDWGALVPSADIDADSVIDPAPRHGRELSRALAAGAPLALAAAVAVAVVALRGMGAPARARHTASAPAHPGIAATPTPPVPTAAPEASVLLRLPAIQGFTLRHDRPGQPYRLAWGTRGALRVTLDGRPVKPTGHYVLRGTRRTRTYLLVAANDVGRVAARVRIVVPPAALVSHTYTVAP